MRTKVPVRQLIQSRIDRLKSEKPPKWGEQVAELEYELILAGNDGFDQHVRGRGTPRRFASHDYGPRERL